MADSWWGEHLLNRGADDDTWAISEAVVSHRELRAGVARYAATLREHGVSAGSTVALRMPPSFSYLRVLLALWQCGAQVILVDHRMPPAEYRPLIEELDPEYEVMADDRSAPAAGFQAEVHPVVRRRPGGTPGRGDLALVQFSSGSTGRPKVIGRSVASLVDELDRHAAMGLLGAGDRALLLNSITHTYGLVSGVLHALASGAVVVLPPSRRPADVVRLMARTEVTAVFGVPAHFELLNRAATPVPSLRLAVSGGERIPPETHAAFRHHFGVPIGQIYGVTETGLVAGDPAGTWPPPAVGPPVPGIDVRVVEGELHIRLPASPYLAGGEPDRYREGWLRTYDRVEQDPRTGVLRILGRADSLAIVGGMKVDLMEVEAVLVAHPRVAEAVVTHGSVIEAFVAADGLTADELTVWCRERLSLVKVPKRFVVTGELPRNATGKLLRNRELIHSRLGDSS